MEKRIDIKEQGKYIQEILEQINALPDGTTRLMFDDCIHAILQLYGSGLDRILDLVRRADTADHAYHSLLNDPSVRGLLLIHGLHPLNLEARLREALEKVRPYMKSHGGDVELVSLENDKARLRLVGTCHGCPSSTMTMELAVRRAIDDACPDLIDLEVEGMNTTASTPENNGAGFTWSVGALKEGEILQKEIAGEKIILFKGEETTYAFRDLCPVCGASFSTGSLSQNLVLCPAGHPFDAAQAGVYVDNSAIRLEPFPLFTENDEVKIVVS